MKTLSEQIEQFKKETGYTLEIRDGKPYYGGWLGLDLSNTPITSLPDNLTVGGWLDLRGTGITSLPDNLTVGGDLYLDGTGITSLPYNLTVGGDLYLSNTPITSLPDNLTVGGNLDLSNTPITSLPDNLTVGGNLDLSNTQITSIPENLTVGGWLDLQGTGITSIPENLTVGGSLDLRGTGITSLPDNLTVGGDLYLDGTGITSLPENLTVGGWLGLDLSNTQITDTSKVNRNATDIYTWRNNKYIKCDGVFSRVLSHKGNVWKVQSIGKDDTMYIVTDGNGRYAHGKTIKAAKADLIYKISNRDKSKYESLTLDSTVTFEEAIEMYRVITGACAAGTKNFVENRLREKKAKYTIAEIIELTKGEYQADVFAEFFKH